MSRIPPPADTNEFERLVQPPFRILRRYHRFQTQGLENVPRQGPALLVGSHSAISYDAMLAVDAIYRQTGRIVRMLGDEFWFRQRHLAHWVQALGAVPASPAIARALLSRGEIVGVAPGGMREALKPREERFQVQWKDRKGFVKLWLQTRVPLVLVTCPAAELAVTVYSNPLTDFIYRRFHQPFPLIRGLGLSLIPRPASLRFHFAKPITLPEGTDESHVDVLHDWLIHRMQAFISRSVTEDGLDAGR